MPKLITNEAAVVLLPLIAAVAACTPSPQDSAMPNQNSGPPAAGSAAIAPPPGSIAEAGNLAQGIKDTPAEAAGRRILSTAFVQVGPDGYLSVEQKGGSVVVLRNVAMRPKDYCGTLASGKKYCGGYAEVTGARPGGGPVSDPAAKPAPNSL